MAYHRGGSGYGGQAQAAPRQPQPEVVETLFPKMRIDEIREDMELFERPMTREELRKPTPEGVRSVFMFFITKLYGTTEDDLCQPAFGCFDSLVNPELHDNSVQQLHFLRACQQLFKHAQYNDNFGLRDLFDPVPSRFMCQMSALMNFVKFREKRVRELLEMTAAGHAMRVRLEELEELNTEVDAEIEAIERQREAEAPQVAEKQAQVDELTVELSQLHQQHVALTEETKQAKNTLQSTVDKIADLKFRVMAFDQESEQLQSLVVSSPDRVQAEIKEMEARVADDKKRLADLQAKRRITVERIVLLAKSKRDVEAACKAVEETAVEMQRAAQMEARVKEQTTKIREFENEKEAISGLCSHLERQIASLVGRRERVRQQREDLGEMDRETEQRLAQQARDADREIDGAKEAISENNRKTGEISRRMQQLVSDFEDEVATVGRKLTVVDKKLAAYCKETETLNGMVDSANRKALADLRNTVNQSLPSGTK
jgi:kinetochore protein Nuf2